MIRSGRRARLEKRVEMANPGHNPVLIPLQRFRGRFLKIEATRLWKAHERYPAFFALSEVEVLDGTENVAAGARVRSPDRDGEPGGVGERVLECGEFV